MGASINMEKYKGKEIPLENSSDVKTCLSNTQRIFYIQGVELGNQKHGSICVLFYGYNDPLCMKIT